MELCYLDCSKSFNSVNYRLLTFSRTNSWLGSGLVRGFMTNGFAFRGGE